MTESDNNIAQFIDESEAIAAGTFNDVPIDTYFKIISTDVDVSALVEKLEQNPDDWHFIGLWSTSDATSTLPYGIIPLTVASTPDPGINIHDSELMYNTAYYHKYNDSLIKWAEDNGYPMIARCGLLTLGAGSATELKRNIGKYYETKDRYYLMLKGKGLFTIHGKEFEVNAGTLFWFNHTETHADMNIGDEDKWVFMFDVPRVEQPKADMPPPELDRGESGEEAVS